MQPWQIKALELEVSGLKHLDGFIDEHVLHFLVGVIYILLALLAWVLNGGLRRKRGKPLSYVRAVIIIHLPEPPPLWNTFNSFPPPHHSAHCDHDDDYWE